MYPSKMHGNEPPKMGATAMKSADIIVTPISYSTTHTDVMIEATGAGGRIIILRGITEASGDEAALTPAHPSVGIAPPCLVVMAPLNIEVDMGAVDSNYPTQDNAGF